MKRACELQEILPRVILEHLGIADIAAHRLDRAVAGHVHDLEQAAPDLAAEVMKPARSEWALNCLASRPTR